MAEWVKTTLGELVDIKHGFAFKGAYFADEPSGDILLTPGNFAIGGGFKADKLKFYNGPVPSEFVLQEGDLIVTMTDLSKQADTLGFPALVPRCSSGVYLHNQRLGKVVITQEASIDKQFLYYLMCSREYRNEVVSSATGTTVKHTSPERIKRFSFLRPPLQEQHAIARTLSALDNKIELNIKMNETLEAMARAIFKSWFVDFDPIPGLGPHKEWQDSPLGRIPKGWQIKSIEDLAERVAMGPFGSSIKVSTFVSDGIPVISGQHLNHTMLEDNEYNFITPAHAEKLKNSNVSHGDIILTHAGNIGQVSYIPETSCYERYVISQRQFFMRPDLTKTSPLFIVYFFQTPEGQHKLLANTSSTGVPSISRPVSYLRTIKLNVPPKCLIDAFDKLVRPMHSQINSNLTQSKSLAAIRDALLPKLLSGEIRVRDAGKFLEGME